MKIHAPTLSGFDSFVHDIMGVPVLALPYGAAITTHCFDISLSVVLLELQGISPENYVIAVYNLGGDLLINYANDLTGQTYFAGLRQLFDISKFVPGVVTNTSDEYTSAGLVNPKAMENLTMMDLQNLKTPYGRRYLGIAQSFGPIWGIS